MFFAGWLLGLWCHRKGLQYFKDRASRLLNR
jgi:hypothetical protein